MAIAFRAGVYAGDASATSASVNKPTGTVDDDILILALYHEDTTDPTTGLSVPAGFTLIANGLTGSPFSLRVYWKRAASEGASYSITWTNNVWHAEVLLAFSGCETSGSPIDAVANGTEATSGTTLTYPSVTTTVADTMLVVLGAGYGGQEGAPSGFSVGAGDGGGSGAGYYKAQAASGATGTFTGAVGAGYSLGHTVALKVPGGATTVRPRSLLTMGVGS